MDEKTTPPPEFSPEKPLPVKFIHEEGAAFRIIHADGGWGSINAQNNIQMNFFVERPPIASVVIHPLQSDGNISPLGQEKYKVDGDEFYVVTRDFQVGVVMSLEVARRVHGVLENFIAVGQEKLRLAEQMGIKKS